MEPASRGANFQPHPVYTVAGRVPATGDERIIRMSESLKVNGDVIYKTYTGYGSSEDNWRRRTTEDNLVGLVHGPMPVEAGGLQSSSTAGLGVSVFLRYAILFRAAPGLILVGAACAK